MNRQSYLLRFINFWPPFLFAGIKVYIKSKDFRHLVVKLKLRFWNANYVGTQYGGSIYSMTDPFYMLMLIKNLGPKYIVWDKTATIQYLKPGKTDLSAEFILTAEELENIREVVKEKGHMLWSKQIDIKDINHQLVAKVEKVISIKDNR